jgi:hypothetical protein
MMMPSGWMPDARHDTRTAFLFDARHDAQRVSKKRDSRHVSTRRTAHKVARRPRVIAHG